MALPITDEATAETPAPAEITVEQRMEAIENVVIQLAQTVNQALNESPAETPKAEKPKAVSGPAFKAPKGAKPPVSKPKAAKAPKAKKARKQFDSSKLTDLPGTATFRQRKALSGLTKPLASGARVKYIGEDDVREYWAFLSMREASNAIDSLKGERKPFKFSNGVTVYPR